MNDRPPESPSGIKVGEDGARYVGGSVRSDGSVRKTVKIRPGFVPAEDVPKYVIRARRTEGPGNASSGGPGGASRPQFRPSAAFGLITKTLQDNRTADKRDNARSGPDQTDDLADALSKVSIADKTSRDEKRVEGSDSDTAKKNGLKERSGASRPDDTVSKTRSEFTKHLKSKTESSQLASEEEPIGLKSKSMRHPIRNSRSKDKKLNPTTSQKPSEKEQKDSSKSIESSEKSNDRESKASLSPETTEKEQNRSSKSIEPTGRTIPTSKDAERSSPASTTSEKGGSRAYVPPWKRNNDKRA
ncbi:hypothetical protein AWJ20_4773 [Sugiyamaella lignohabitans]|uniref:WIBG Mago-binding domain-containing protein n=1 Tax=Sugiyamaella lignohabitans TaxID=796027 RepID=A0A167EA47_9ASCO|nr:uncharacterized protein AWJ20_4773 [Sugiyamaella lignohabitans]ANB13826.1 hypothetical protein AWJ20_4773 [Sugiyamaella lignohabitans]